MGTVTVSPKFQVVIPRAVREALGIEPGQRVEVFSYDNRVEMVLVREPGALRGLLEGIDTSVEREQDRL